MLEASGFRVRVETKRRARVAPDELTIAFAPRISPASPDDEEAKLTDRLPPTARRVLLIGTGEGDGELRPVTAESEFGARTYRLALLATDVRAPELNAEGGLVLTRLGRDGEELAYVVTTPKRRIVSLAHGELALNRGLDRGENAAYLVGLVRALTPGKDVVLYEGLNDAGDGLLAALGDWAFAARNQAFLVLGTLVFAFGSRFGLPPKARRRERGQREQSDALGNLLRRWRGPSVGIEAGVEQARRRLVKARRLPASAPRDQWVKYLSPELLARFDDCDEWVRQDAKEREALAALARLDAAVAAELERPRTLPG